MSFDCKKHSVVVRQSSPQVVLALTIVLSGVLIADVRLPSIIGDNMVLQQGIEVPIWGWADPCEHIVIKFGPSSIAWPAIADANGKWETRIGPLNAGGPYEMTIEGKNTLTLKNILVGEVWVCSGQSNMEFPVSRSVNAEQEINEANYPMIRLFTVGKKVSYTPMADCKGQWQVCGSQSVSGFSAVGYFFGRELNKQLNVPIGLINASWGGTPAGAWMSKEYLENEPNFKPILKRFEDTSANYPELKKKYGLEKRQYDAMAAKLKAEGKPLPPKPEEPIGLNHPYSPTGLFNGMITPVIPYGIHGAIWYQGESNAGRASQYRTLFPAMIKNWRQAWRQGDFPFLYVQLANYMAVSPEPQESDWAELREAQLMTLSTPNTGMAVAIDIGEANDIHPKNKQDVGKRLALWALARTYKKDIEYSGPLYKYMEVEGDKAVLHFDHVDGGLVVSTPSTSSPDHDIRGQAGQASSPQVAGGGGAVKGFAIAGEDRKFVWADAEIKGNTVIVRSDKVTVPVAVRYGWADNPVCNLYNKAGLPASPFRTDVWPGITDNRR